MKELLPWIVAALLSVLLVTVYEGNLRRNAPCSELGGWTVNNLPARCIMPILNS